MMNNTKTQTQNIKVGQIWSGNTRGTERRIKAINGYDVITIRWDENLGTITTSWEHDEFLATHTLKEETK